MRDHLARGSQTQMRQRKRNFNINLRLAGAEAKASSVGRPTQQAESQPGTRRAGASQGKGWSQLGQAALAGRKEAS